MAELRLRCMPPFVIGSVAGLGKSAANGLVLLTTDVGSGRGRDNGEIVPVIVLAVVAVVGGACSGGVGLGSHGLALAASGRISRRCTRGRGRAAVEPDDDVSPPVAVAVDVVRVGVSLPVEPAVSESPWSAGPDEGGRVLGSDELRMRSFSTPGTRSAEAAGCRWMTAMASGRSPSRRWVDAPA